MDKVKLVDGTLLSAESIELINGVLKISTRDNTVDGLVGLFSDPANTHTIVILTNDDVECERKIGFTSFAGIHYSADGLMTVEMFQPTDDMELRVASAEAAASAANSTAEVLVEQTEILAITLDSILTDIIPSLIGE